MISFYAGAAQCDQLGACRRHRTLRDLVFFGILRGGVNSIYYFAVVNYTNLTIIHDHAEKNPETLTVKVLR